MNHSEKRNLPRIAPGNIPAGALSLVHQGQRIEIENLRDISDSGISFSLKQMVAVSENISIEYSDHKVKLEVFGRVAWCRQVQASDQAVPHSANCLMGVELLSPMMLYAVLPNT